MSAKELEALIDEISANIAAQRERERELLKQLLHSKSAAQRQLNSLRDPVARLPLEISSEIFLRCLPDHSPKPRARTAPMLLLNICQTWTQIALSNSILWTSIALNFPAAEILRLWFERARNETLSVTLRSGLSTAVVDVVMRYATQLKHLGIYDEENIDFLARAEGIFPCLQTLTIGSAFYDDDLSVGVLDVLAVLRTAPNLLECTFRGLSMYDNTSRWTRRTLVLSNLTCMKFEPNADGDFSRNDVLAYLELPALQALFCCFNSVQNNDLLLFLQRSSPPLQKLVIGHDRFNFVEADQWLRLVPTLVHLEMEARDSVVDEFFVALAESPSDFIPNLQDLTIQHKLHDPPYETLLRALSVRRTRLAAFKFTTSYPLSRPSVDVGDALRQLGADGVKIYIAGAREVLLDSTSEFLSREPIADS
ncbi:hypothetical protein C8F04DRAFT_1238329 [Mycena alexandri]|uniref:F-box domain-containing protein n=1 Tax=Mycena alexandri TaxID=1745969 RepID=A0AAD6SFF1_9AGAR|nr:hypothetical protein C8F04DRAFT_1238329 [Mycena alexandri]